VKQVLEATFSNSVFTFWQQSHVYVQSYVYFIGSMQRRANYQMQYQLVTYAYQAGLLHGCCLRILFSVGHCINYILPLPSLWCVPGWHYTSSPFISYPVILSRSFRPLIHFVPGHFVPSHFVPWSFRPLVISSPRAESTEVPP
jgi:hypothetical protein